MLKFRKKPLVIEAVQFTGDVGSAEIVALDLACGHDPAAGHDFLEIGTVEGATRAGPGDWIIRGAAGELSLCKDDLFRRSYEPATEP